MYTELELVNHILFTLGESTTPTLETQHPAVQNARAILMSYNKEFQGLGWWFNRELNLKLLPNAEGKVRVPTEALSFRVTKCVLEARSPAQKARFVKRGNFVYDTLEHTDVLNCAVWADIIVLLDYSDLPQAAGAYLKHWAAEQAFLADDGDIQVKRELGINTATARAMLKQEEMKSIGVNAFDRPMAQQLLLGAGQAYDNPRFLGGRQ